MKHSRTRVKEVNKFIRFASRRPWDYIAYVDLHLRQGRRYNPSPEEGD